MFSFCDEFIYLHNNTESIQLVNLYYYFYYFFHYLGQKTLFLIAFIGFLLC